MITLTSAEAQNKFGQLLDTVQRESVTITRHGRTAAIVVSQQEMDALLDARLRRTAFMEAYEAWREEARKSTTSVVEELTDEDVVRLVHELR
jgi:prevent-host-death family protein